MHLPTKVSTFISQSEEWRVETDKCYKYNLTIKKFGHQYKGVTYPNINPQKNKRRCGDGKKKLELDKVFYENEAWWNVNILFRELSKWKPMFIKKS
jgi:hypothetical protein